MSSCKRIASASVAWTSGWNWGQLGTLRQNPNPKLVGCWKKSYTWYWLNLIRTLEVAFLDPDICWNAGFFSQRCWILLWNIMKQLDQTDFCSNQSLVNRSPQHIWSKMVVLSVVAELKSHWIWATKQKARGQKRSPDESRLSSVQLKRTTGRNLEISNLQ